MKIRFNITCVIFSMLLFGMISSSQAGKITSLTVYAGDDWGDEGGYTYAQLETDSDIHIIYCFVKQTYPHDEVDDAYEQVYYNKLIREQEVIFVNLDS